MMKRWLFVIVALFVAVVSVNAVPAIRGIWRVLKLVDGTEVRAELRGDEHLHYWQSADGKKYMESGQDGVYKLIDESTFRSRARGVRRNMARTMEPAKSKLPDSVLTGSHRGLIILVEFPDTDEGKPLTFRKDHTKEYYKWLTNTKTSLIPSEEGKRLIDEGYGGSVFDYFYTQSNGKFSVQFDVVGPYMLSREQQFYGENTDSVNPKDTLGAREMIVEACELAVTDPDVFFPRYDWDNDGVFDLVYVIYVGRSEPSSGKPNQVWPQSFAFRYEDGTLATTYDRKGIEHSLLFGGKNLNRCACSSEFEVRVALDGQAEHDFWGREIEIDGGIGTICHEFSHCLGLMDHYVINKPDVDDPSMEPYALGRWDIMDGGNYNGDGKVPAGYNSFEKAFLGWRDPIEVDEVGSVKVSGLRPYSEGGHAYKVKNHANENEYYLIENRQKTGWDKALPGSGVLITHMDYDDEKYYDYNNEGYAINNADDYLRFRVVPADNVYTKVSQDGDTYPHTSYLVFTNDRLDDTSEPKGTVYNQNIDGTKNWAIPSRISPSQRTVWLLLTSYPNLSQRICLR